MGTGEEESPSLSADGRRLAFAKASQRYTIRLVDLAGGQESMFSERVLLAEPAIAPDRSAMAFVSLRMGSDDIWVERLRNGVPDGDPVRVTDHPGSTAHPVFSPDGRWIAYFRVVGDQRDVWIVPAGGGLPAQFTSDPAKDVHPEWSPDGSQLAFVSDRSGSYELWVAPVSEGHRAGEPRRVTTTKGTAMFPAWSPDGTSIAFIEQSDTGGEVFVAPVDGAAPPRRLTTGADAATLVWNRATGRLLACGGWGKETPTVQIVPLDGGRPEPLPGLPASRPGVTYSDFDLSPDGTLLTPELASFLAAHDVELEISFDGVPEAQAARGAGTFWGLARLLNRLAGANPELMRRRVHLGMTLTSGNAGTLAASVRFLMETGAAAVHVSPTITRDDGWGSDSGELLRRQMDPIVERSLQRWIASGTVPVSFLAGGGGSSEPAPDGLPCSAGTGRLLCVDPDGRPWTCPALTGSTRTLPPLARDARNALDLGSSLDACLTGRLARLPARARRTPLFASPPDRRSHAGPCRECEHITECHVCPAALLAPEQPGDPPRVPDLHCAFNRITAKARRRFRERLRGPALLERLERLTRSAQES